MPASWLIAVLLTILALLAAAVIATIRLRHMQYWIGNYAFPAESLPPWHPDDPVDVFIAVCDHWEPFCQEADEDLALSRVRRWRTEYPELFARFADVNGRPPQHTFFYPQDEYHAASLDSLRELVDGGWGDVDVHLHHDRDTAEQLREKLEAFRETLFHRHGLLRRDPLTGEIVYGFIHGNWSLCNSRPDGHLCGVDQELSVLLATGCYADFTLPSAPSPTQTSTINSIYYAQDIPGQRKSHDRGIRARVGQSPPADHLLMIQGPLGLDWSNRRWGVIPRTENSDLHVGRPATLRRLALWMNAGVHVQGRPEWRFIKLHTHGCKTGNIDTLLGPESQQFHRELSELHRRHPNFRYHYVTAWEMAQLVHQAESGATRPDWPSLRPTASPIAAM